MSEDGESENRKTDGIIKQTIDSATALSKAVPIYEDAVQPFAKETGKALETLGKAVNVALAPISLVVWGYDQMKDFLENKVTEKLEHVPEDRIITPPPNIAGPAIEALKFTGHDETLQDMFANLIANSLDSRTVVEAHPSFVDIIKNLSPDEGLILKVFASSQQFPVIDVKLQNKKEQGYSILHRNVTTLGSVAGCDHQQLTENYLDNLCRLGVLEIPAGIHLTSKNAYDEIINDQSIKRLQAQFEDNENYSIGFNKKLIQVTGIGRQFINACVVDKRTKQ